MTSPPLLLLTVTEVETRAILAELETRSGQPAQIHYHDDKSYFECGTIADTRVVLVRAEMGADTPGGSLITVNNAIHHLQPHAVIMLGIAFGMDRQTQPVGTVLISQQLQAYDFKKIQGGKTQPWGDRVAASIRLLDRFRTAQLSWNQAAVQFTLLLSGQTLVDDIDFREQLAQTFPGAGGGEMEGAGVYAAARKIDWLVVKAVCDWADGNKDENKTAYQQKAASMAAALVVHTLAQGGLKPANGPAHSPEPEDTSPTAAHPLPPASSMPLPHNPNFVGRSRELEQLHLLLGNHATAVIDQVAVATGHGGIGKTQLARAYVHHYGRFYPGGVYWLNLAEAQGVPAELVRCGEAMGLFLPDADLAIGSKVHLVKQAWCDHPQTRLLVFDNCEDEALLLEWRPVGGDNRIVITARRRQWSPAVKTLALDVLTRPESLALLKELCPSLKPEWAEAIAVELGDLPLALHLTGCYFQSYRGVVSLQSWLNELTQQGLQHPALTGKGKNDPADHDSHVARTFLVSTSRLNPELPLDALAQKLLNTAACLAPGETIPQDLLFAAAGLSEAEALTGIDGLNRLAELGLLAREDGLRLHRLLHLFVRETETPQILAEIEQQVVHQVLQRASKINQHGLPGPMEALLPHLRYLCDARFEQRTEDAASLCANLAYYLVMISDFPGAEVYYRQALLLAEEVFGQQHGETALCLNNLAQLLQDTNRLDEAEPLMRRALGIFETSLGSSHPNVATQLNNLAQLLQATNRLDEAEPLMRRALAIDQASFGDHHPEVARDLNNLAQLLQDTNRLEEAEPLMRRALAIARESLGPEHPHTIIVQGNLKALLAQGQA